MIRCCSGKIFPMIMEKRKWVNRCKECGFYSSCFYGAASIYKKTASALGQGNGERYDHLGIESKSSPTVYQQVEMPVTPSLIFKLTLQQCCRGKMLKACLVLMTFTFFKSFFVGVLCLYHSAPNLFSLPSYVDTCTQVTAMARSNRKRRKIYTLGHLTGSYTLIVSFGISRFTITNTS